MGEEDNWGVISTPSVTPTISIADSLDGEPYDPPESTKRLSNFEDRQ